MALLGGQASNGDTAGVVHPVQEGLLVERAFVYFCRRGQSVEIGVEFYELGLGDGEGF